MMGDLAKHTPGPWVAERAAVLAGQRTIALAWPNPATDDGSMHANARLMAAAPDLEDAVKPFAFCDANNPPPGVSIEDWRPAVIAARQALAKARAA